MGLHELVLLRVGSRGAAVKAMQEDLGIDADGRFGPGTKKAVMDFQKENGLTVDGMAGPANAFQNEILLVRRHRRNHQKVRCDRLTKKNSKAKTCRS